MHRRRGRHRDLRGGAGQRRDEAVLVERDRLAASDFRLCKWRSELAGMTVVIVESEDRVLHHQSAREPHEFLPVRDAPKLAVGDHLDAAVMLQLHHVTNRSVLRSAELGVGDFLGCVCPKRLAQRRRAQQAADVVGPVGRASIRVNAHRETLVFGDSIGQ